MPLAQEKLSYAIIGKAMEVHRELGPGVKEVFHHALLSERLRAAGVEHLFKPRQALIHRGYVADTFEADLVFPNRLIAELKWLWGRFAPEHFLQLKGYLKFWRIKDGLLFDFGKESLMQKRYILEDTPPPEFDLTQAMAEAACSGIRNTVAGALCVAVSSLTSTYGFGYRDTTYRGLLDAELRAEGIVSIAGPLATVPSGSRRLGECQLPCLAVANECAVMVLSQREEIRAADRAIVQSWLSQLEFAWGLIVHFGKCAVQLPWITAPWASRNT